MRTGIFVHSQTGNTLQVAERLREALAEKGCEAEVERIVPIGDPAKDLANIRFEAPPEISGYDAIVLASPVQGFTLSPVMAAWLKLLPALSGRKAACFVTKGLGGDWTGGTRSIRALSKAVQDKGGVIAGSGIVHWGKRDAETAAVVESLCGVL